jgi:hypothetical protein
LRISTSPLKLLNFRPSMAGGHLDRVGALGLAMAAADSIA